MQIWRSPAGITESQEYKLQDSDTNTDHLSSKV